jgi:hypothetical protein
VRITRVKNKQQHDEDKTFHGEKVRNDVCFSLCVDVHDDSSALLPHVVDGRGEQQLLESGVAVDRIEHGQQRQILAQQRG